MDIRDEQQSQRREPARPAGRRKFRLREGKAFFKQPTVWTPKMADQRVDEARNQDVRVALAELDEPAIGIDPAPFVTSHDRWAAKAPVSKWRRVICNSEIFSAHDQRIILAHRGGKFILGRTCFR